MIQPIIVKQHIAIILSSSIWFGDMENLVIRNDFLPFDVSCVTNQECMCNAAPRISLSYACADEQSQQ